MLLYNEESGQGLVEYSLILSFVVMVVLIMLFVLGPAVANMFSKVTSKFP